MAILFPLTVLTAMIASYLTNSDVLLGWPNPINLSALSPAGLLLVCTGVATQIGLYLVPLLYLRRLFRHWSRGEILTRQAARSIQATGIAMLVAVTCGMLILPLIDLSLVEIAHGPNINLDLGNILVAGVTYVVGMVLDEAARLADDAKLVI